MTKFFVHLRMLGVWVWLALAAVVVVLAWIFLRPLLGREAVHVITPSKLVEQANDKRETVLVEAAQNVAKARENEAAVREEVETIKREPDQKKRLLALAKLLKRT